MKRYIFIGSVEYSAYCLKALLDINVNIVEIMCPSKENAKANSDYSDLSEVAGEYGKEVYYFKRIKDEAEHIKRNRPDVIFVLGLSQIIPSHILTIPTMGCIGSHPALLPRNRGRHPIIWAIANGLKKSGITLFWIDEGVDSGDIWDQREFDIDGLDDAASVYEKVERLSVEMLKENVSDLENGKINRVEQNSEKASYWRKRTIKDGEIDWRMSGKRIYDLVRALSKPYVGAHCMYREREIKIWKVKMLNEVKGISECENCEPGKVVSIDRKSINIKTGDGIIAIVEHGFSPIPEEGTYL